MTTVIEETAGSTATSASAPRSNGRAPKNGKAPPVDFSQLVANERLVMDVNGVRYLWPALIPAGVEYVNSTKADYDEAARIVEEEYEAALAKAEEARKAALAKAAEETGLAKALDMADTEPIAPVKGKGGGEISDADFRRQNTAVREYVNQYHPTIKCGAVGKLPPAAIRAWEVGTGKKYRRR